MYLLKAIFLVGIAIGVWLIAPLVIAIGSTVALIVFIRYIIKEDAEVRKLKQR